MNEFTPPNTQANKYLHHNIIQIPWYAQRTFSVEGIPLGSCFPCVAAAPPGRPFVFGVLCLCLDLQRPFSQPPEVAVRLGAAAPKSLSGDPQWKVMAVYGILLEICWKCSWILTAGKPWNWTLMSHFPRKLSRHTINEWWSWAFGSYDFV